MEVRLKREYFKADLCLSEAKGMVVNMILGIYLAICTIFDIWKKKVYLIPALITGVIGIAAQVIKQPFTWSVWAGGILLGCCLLIVAKVSGEAIGYGDGVAVIVIGIWLGLYQTMEVLLLALTMAAIFSAILLLFFKVGRKFTIPFIPFLFSACLLIWLMD